MYKIVLLRHGESQWNKENRFTGWADVGLTEQGMREAKQAAALLSTAGFAFDLVRRDQTGRSRRNFPARR